jgi:aspartyl protease family protein
VVELTPDSLSQYRARVEINGARINALVDTGASHVFLTAEDARLLNIDPPASAYTARSQTANGVALNAPTRLREVRVGDIVVYDVEAFVAQPGRSQISLLGMSFLKKLSSFQVSDGQFVMKQ